MEAVEIIGVIYTFIWAYPGADILHHRLGKWPLVESSYCKSKT